MERTEGDKAARRKEPTDQGREGQNKDEDKK